MNWIRRKERPELEPVRQTGSETQPVRIFQKVWIFFLVLPHKIAYSNRLRDSQLPVYKIRTRREDDHTNNPHRFVCDLHCISSNWLHQFLSYSRSLLHFSSKPSHPLMSGLPEFCRYKNISYRLESGRTVLSFSYRFHLWERQRVNGEERSHVFY